MEKLSEMAGFLKDSQSNDPEADKHKLLMKHYLHLDKSNPLHIRRTFDQYCYYTLKSTADRDSDQLLSRVKPDNFGSHLPLLMVDQLWLWILSDGKYLTAIMIVFKSPLANAQLRSGTVITSFPERWSHGEAGDPEPSGRTDVFKNIRRNIREAKTPHGLAGLIAGECIRSCFDPVRHLNKFPDVLEIYDNGIGKIVRALPSASYLFKLHRRMRRINPLRRRTRNLFASKSSHRGFLRSRPPRLPGKVSTLSTLPMKSIFCARLRTYEMNSTRCG
jgi:hypothetical protein